MTPEWIAEERRLWNAMFVTPEIIENRRNTRKLRQVRRKYGAKAAEQTGRSRGMMTEAQAVTRSHKAYEAWVRH